MADIFREVDEELRREGLAKLWRRYGAIIVGAVAAVVLAVAAYTAWQHYAAEQRLERAAAYAAAVGAIDDDADQAVPALQALAAGDDGYAALAHLQAAALKAEAGEVEDAVAIYRNLAANDDIEPAFRNLASLLVAAYSLDTAPPEDLVRSLEPLAEATSPWRYSAREFLALLAVRTGDTARAIELYQGLADDLDAPSNLRARAAEMLASLQG